MTTKRNPLDDLKELQVEAELGGLATEAGKLAGGGPPTHRPIVPNSIRLEDGFLFWDYVATEGPSPPFKEVDPGGALDRFIRIRSGRGVLKFARRYGPLPLCSHGFPAWHPVQGSSETCRPTKRESVDRWLHYSRQARALVLAGASMRQGKPASREAWEELFQSHRTKDGLFPGSVNDLIEKLCHPSDKRLIAAATWLYLKPMLDTWIGQGHVRPSISPSWDPSVSSKTIELVGSGAFAILGIQLLTSVIGSQGFYSCNACGEPFRPNRRPQSGRRCYCTKPACKKSGATTRKRKERQLKKGSPASSS